MLAALAALLLLADPKAQLEALKEKQAAEAAAAEELGRKEVSILDALSEAEEARIVAESAARKAEVEQADGEAKLAAAAKAAEVAEARLGERMRALAPRLAARYRLGRGAEARALLASTSLADLVKRKYLLDRVLSQDLASVREARDAADARARALAEREAIAARLKTVLAEAEAQRAEARKRRELRTRLLSALRGKKALHEKAAVEAAAQGKKLAEFVAALPPPRAGGTGSGFASRKGKLPFPADGQIEVGFGKVVNPRFNTVTIQNGVDIGAEEGSPVEAVAPGTVVHAGWFKGYGNLVIVDHGEGFHTLVAHLKSMSTAMGERVEEGTRLGTVGDTGSIKGVYLYFEIRHKGRPLDPSEWLSP